MKPLRIGFIPLIDAAIAITAVECGFAEQEGLQIELVREVSWANIRDKLTSEIFDAAHMLAPLSIASSLGLGGQTRTPFAVPFGLNANGNCITLAASLYRTVQDISGQQLPDPVASARAIRTVTQQRKRLGLPPLTFGVVFPFSIHAILIRYWLKLGGVDVNNDVQFAVVPPPFTVENLTSGAIDGYCVGEPWNSRAVESGAGSIAVFGSELNRFAPDKVLVLREPLVRDEGETVLKLLRAYKAAAGWCGDPANHTNLSQILSRSDYLNVSPKTILNGLSGTLPVNRTESRKDGDFLILDDHQVNCPDPRRACWLYNEVKQLLGQAPDPAEMRAAASVFRPDLYTAAVGPRNYFGPDDPVQLKFGPSLNQSLDEYIAAAR
jgi:NitT/TauT family transport system ATP-binding protein